MNTALNATTFAVILDGQPTGWLVDATCALVAVVAVRERTPEGRATPDGNWRVWAHDDEHEHHLLGTAAPMSWIRL